MDFVSGRDGADFLFQASNVERTGDFYEYGELGEAGKDIFYREILSSSRFYTLKSNWLYVNDFTDSRIFRGTIDVLGLRVGNRLSVPTPRAMSFLGTVPATGRLTRST